MKKNMDAMTVKRLDLAYISSEEERRLSKKKKKNNFSLKDQIAASLKNVTSTPQKSPTNFKADDFSNSFKADNSLGRGSNIEFSGSTALRSKNTSRK